MVDKNRVTEIIHEMTPPEYEVGPPFRDRTEEDEHVVWFIDAPKSDNSNRGHWGTDVRIPLDSDIDEPILRAYIRRRLSQLDELMRRKPWLI